MASYLLDTSAINAALDQAIEPGLLTGRVLFVTHIQVDELRATRKPPGRLEALLQVLSDIEPEKLPTAAAVWNVSKWNECQYGDSSALYQPMLAALNIRKWRQSKQRTGRLDRRDGDRQRADAHFQRPAPRRGGARTRRHHHDVRGFPAELIEIAGASRTIDFAQCTRQMRPPRFVNRHYGRPAPPG